MALDSLQPLLEKLQDWAGTASIPIAPGILELTESFPAVTVVAFTPEDVDTFCTLARTMGVALLILNAPPLSDEDLRLAKGLASDLKHPADRRHYQHVIEGAAAHLGELHELHAVGFAPTGERAIVLHASPDWAEEIFSLASLLREQGG